MSDEDDALLDDSLIDESQQEGHIYAFTDEDDGNDIDPDFFAEVDNEEQRRTYLADTFEGNGTTRWRQDSEKVAICIDNGAERVLLTGIKHAITPTLSMCKWLSRKNCNDLNEPDFASLYLNRGWYLKNYHQFPHTRSALLHHNSWSILDATRLAITVHLPGHC